MKWPALFSLVGLVACTGSPGSAPATVTPSGTLAVAQSGSSVPVVTSAAAPFAFSSGASFVVAEAGYTGTFSATLAPAGTACLILAASSPPTFNVATIGGLPCQGTTGTLVISDTLGHSTTVFLRVQ